MHVGTWYILPNKFVSVLHMHNYNQVSGVTCHYFLWFFQKVGNNGSFLSIKAET